MHAEVGDGRMGQAFAKPTHLFTWREGRERIDERDETVRKERREKRGKEGKPLLCPITAKPARSTGLGILGHSRASR